MFFQGTFHRGSAKQKNARIPKMFPRFKITLRRFPVGFFFKGFYRRNGILIFDFDIAIACDGCRWLYAKEHNLPCVSCIQAIGDRH